MKEVHPSLEKQNASQGTPLCCSQCGWPGTGKMPAGVCLIKQEGKTVLVGSLSYFGTKNPMDSVPSMQFHIAFK